jgi:hypothetical protein
VPSPARTLSRTDHHYRHLAAAAGVTAREVGLNPRALGTNPRAKAGGDGSERYHGDGKQRATAACNCVQGAGPTHKTSVTRMRLSKRRNPPWRQHKMPRATVCSGRATGWGPALSYSL